MSEMREEVCRIQADIDDYLRFVRLRKPQRKPVELNEFFEQKLASMGSAVFATSSWTAYGVTIRIARCVRQIPLAVGTASAKRFGTHPLGPPAPRGHPMQCE